MEGRPYLRFVYVENAVGGKHLITTPAGDIIEDLSPDIEPNKQVIQAVAATDISKGQLLSMSMDGRVSPATKDSGKAVGYAMADGVAGYTLDIQVGGVYEGYDRWVLTPGTVYYQDNDGEIRWKDDQGNTHKHPAALALTKDSFIILTEIYMGTGSGGGSGGTVIVEALTVKREERHFSDITMALTEACSISSVMTDIFQTNGWDNAPFICKQILTVKNTSAMATLQIDIRHKGVSSAIDNVPANTSITIPVTSSDWSLYCRGSYEVDLVVEVVSGRLPPAISTTPPADPSGLNIYEYTDPADNTKKYVIIGQIKRFDIITDPTSDTTGLLFDYPKWIDDNIDSTDYLILGSIKLTNVAADTSEVKITDTTGRVLYTFDIPAGADTLIDLHREDIKMIATVPGSIRAEVDLQVTAYKFKGGA